MTWIKETSHSQDWYNEQFKLFVAEWKKHDPCLPLDKQTARACVLLSINKRREDLMRILDGGVLAYVDDAGVVIFTDRNF